MVQGVTISTRKNKQTGATRIEVDSEAYNEDSMFHDETLETSYQEQLKNLFRGFGEAYQFKTI